jgi:hypothetical protein
LIEGVLKVGIDDYCLGCFEEYLSGVFVELFEVLDWMKMSCLVCFFVIERGMIFFGKF